MTIPRPGRKPRFVIRIDEEQGPTPETKAKLRPDRLQELFTAGLIDQQQLGAGEEIRAIVDAISAMHFRAVNLGGADKTGGGSRHPLDGLRPALQRAHRTRYLPWVHAMKDRKFQGVSYAQILIGVVVDSHALSDYAEETPGGLLAAAAVIREALDAY